MSVIGAGRRREREPDPNAVGDVDGRPPPHDLDAERALLSVLMIDPDGFDRVSWVKHEWFYSEAHRWVFLAVLGCRSLNRPCDSVNVAGWLQERDRLAQVGGMSALALLLNAPGDVAHVDSYARLVRDAYRMRQAVTCARKFAALAYVEHGTAEEYLAGFEREVTTLGSLVEVQASRSFGRVLEEVWKRTKDDQQLGRLPGIGTAFVDYDAITLGLQPKALDLVGARPGMGKTSWALCLALNVARRVPELFEEAPAYSGVAFFSMEMPREELMQRVVAIESAVPLSAIRSRRLGDAQWTRMSQAASRLHPLPIEIDDSPRIDIGELRGKIRRIRAKMERPGYRPGNTPTRLRVVFLDYIQLLRARGEMIRTREQEVSTIARDLKELAKDEGLAIVGLCQLSRALEARSGPNRRPMLSDLRESGELEQAADRITFLHREEYYRDAKVAEGDEGKTELIVAKHRNGPTGTAYVRFSKDTTAFENM